MRVAKRMGQIIYGGVYFKNHILIQSYKNTTYLTTPLIYCIRIFTFANIVSARRWQFTSTSCCLKVFSCLFELFLFFSQSYLWNNCFEKWTWSINNTIIVWISNVDCCGFHWYADLDTRKSMYWSSFLYFIIASRHSLLFFACMLKKGIFIWKSIDILSMSWLHLSMPQITICHPMLELGIKSCILDTQVTSSIKS